MIPVISPNYFMQKASYMQAKLIADTIEMLLDVVLLHFVKNLLLHSRNLRINQGAIRHNRSLALTFIPFAPLTASGTRQGD